MVVHRKRFAFVSFALLAPLILSAGLIGCSSSDDDGGTTPVVDTTPPAPVSSFLALPGDGRATLSWINPQDPGLAGVEVRRATDATPTRTTGEVIYDGTAVSHADEGLVNDQTYHYAAFAYDYAGNYSTGADDTCTPHVAAAVTIPDENLELALRTELGIPSGDITDLALATLQVFDAGNEEIADLQGLQHAVNLIELDLGGNLLTNDSNLQLLAQLLDLQKLTLSSNDITILPDLSMLTKLETFYAFDVPITSLSPLGGVTSLQRLQFSNCDVSDLTPLANLTSLEYLSFASTEVTSLGPLSGLDNLLSLQADSNPIGSAAPLTSLSNLLNLNLSHTAVTDLSDLSSMTQLTDLGLMGNDIDDLTPLAGLTGLNYLGIGGNRITDLGPLAALTAMTSLSLGDNSISDLSALSGMTAMRYFNANNNLISDVTVLLGYSGLQMASLQNNPLTTSAVENDLATLRTGGVDVTFGYDEGLLQLMGPWRIGSITVNGSAVEPGEFFDWDAATVTNTLTVYPYGAYVTNDLDADGDVVYIETGYLEVDATSVSVVVYTEDGVDVTPHEAFSGTWARSGEDLVFTALEGEDTVVMTWIR